MCTCYNPVEVSVLDHGVVKTVRATVEDVECICDMTVERDGEMIDALLDREVLSDEAVDQVIAHIRTLAAERHLPCCCSNPQGEYCACHDLSSDFVHPRKGGNLSNESFLIDEAARSLLVEAAQLLSGKWMGHNMSLLNDCIATMRKDE